MRPLSLWFSWLTLAVFTAFFVIKGNREFLLYAATLAILILLVQGSDRRLRYPAGVLWCFWLWLVLHMCGGFVHLGGVRLYDIRLLPLVGEPYQILRYDQFVHAFCYFTIGGLLKTIIAAQAAPGASRRGLALLTLLAALGVGAVNEIIEFTAVAWFRSDGVGDYFNNALDNVFNAAGALAALALLPVADGTAKCHNGGHEDHPTRRVAPPAAQCLHRRRCGGPCAPGWPANTGRRRGTE